MAKVSCGSRSRLLLQCLAPSAANPPLMQRQWVFSFRATSSPAPLLPSVSHLRPDHRSFSSSATGLSVRDEGSVAILGVGERSHDLSRMLESHVEESTSISGEKQPWLAADLAEVPNMGSKQIRRLAQAAASVLQEQGPGSVDPRVWSEVSAQCLAIGQGLDVWDVIFILQAFTQAQAGDRAFYMQMAEIAASKASKLAPKRILDLFAVYEANQLRPRALYVELFYTIVRLAPSMYPEEVAVTLQALARYRIGNPTVVAHLARSAKQQVADMRLRYLCTVVGALGSLQALPPGILDEFNERAKIEVETIPVQELLDNTLAFPKMEFSWKPYEDLCLQTFVDQVTKFETGRDVEMLKDPFETMHFLQAKGLLNKPYLEAMVQWCLHSVHRPNVLSQRRPTARQLVLLHDRCATFGIGADAEAALHDAITYYVESGGGQWPAYQPQPLRFARFRRYVRTDDPLQAEQHPARVPAPDPNLPPYHAVAMGTTQAYVAEDPAAPLPAELHAQIAVGPRKVPQGIHSNARVTTRARDRSHDRKLDVCKPRWKTPKKPRLPLFQQGGYKMRPKYTPGVATGRLPWAGVPPGCKGPAWVLRR